MRIDPQAPKIIKHTRDAQNNGCPSLNSTSNNQDYGEIGVQKNQVLIGYTFHPISLLKA